MSPVDVEGIFRREIRRVLLGQAPDAPAGPPVAVFVGGQPGAGKTTLEDRLRTHLGSGTMLLDLDNLRAYHPRYAAWRAEDDRTADDRAHDVARQWFDRAVDLCVELRRHAVVSCTLGDPASAARKIRRFADGGYRVEVVLVGVHQACSELSVVERYLRERARDGVGRYVPLRVQREAYDGLPHTAALVDGGDLADAAEVRRRNGTVEYANAWHDGGWRRPGRLRDALLDSRSHSYADEADWFACTFDRLARQPVPEQVRHDLIAISVAAAACDATGHLGAVLQYRATANAAIRLLRAHPAAVREEQR